MLADRRLIWFISLSWKNPFVGVDVSEVLNQLYSLLCFVLGRTTFSSIIQIVLQVGSKRPSYAGETVQRLRDE
jgi:hypothetical protein